MENNNNLRWRSTPLNECNIPVIAKKLHQMINHITLDGFEGKTDFALDVLIASLNQSHYFSMLVEVANEDVMHGFSLLTVPPCEIEDSRLVWINKICIDQNNQGKGYGTEQMLKELSEAQNINIGFVGCKTQNPFLAKKLESMSSMCFPFHKSYYARDIGSLGRDLLYVMIKHITQITKPYKEALENTNGPLFLQIPAGILRNEYSKQLAPDIEYDAIAHFPTEKYLNQNNFSRSNGDSVVIISKLK